MDKAKFVSSNKNKPILVDGPGFKYKKKRDAGVNKYWVCRKSGCSMKAVRLFTLNMLLEFGVYICMWINFQDDYI